MDTRTYQKRLRELLTFINKILKSEKWTKEVRDLLTECQLEEFSIVLGSALTEELIKKINFTGRRDIIKLLRRYLERHPSKWEKFLKFVTGSADPHITINVDLKEDGLPTSSTCFNTIYLRRGYDYKSLKRELDISLANSEGMGLS